MINRKKWMIGFMGAGVMSAMILTTADAESIQSSELQENHVQEHTNHRIGHLKGQGYFIKHKEETLTYLSTYLGQSKDELQAYLDDGIKLHRLVHLAPLTKVTGDNMDTLVELGSTRDSIHDYLDKKGVDREDIKVEMKQFRQGLQKQLETK